jgi:hypothetical protein
MHKRLLFPVFLALTLGGLSSAQEGPKVTAPASYADVPAGHWAANAVKYVSDKGILRGFPDLTFRGDAPLTRYQAALIFYRLLQEGGLSQMDNTGKDIVMKGMEEVKPELEKLGARLDVLEQANTDRDAVVLTLENSVKDLQAQVAELMTKMQALEAASKVPGPQGPAGEKGEKGDKGEMGAAGVAGATGATGATGPAGEAGPVGKAGEAGVAGVAGAAGPAGEKGEQGEQGEQGAAGAAGEAGAAGPAGEKGDKGDTGAKGDTGPKGDTGATGPKGDKGDTGAKGDKGTAGVTTEPTMTDVKPKPDTTPTKPKTDTETTVILPDQPIVVATEVAPVRRNFYVAFGGDYPILPSSAASFGDKVNLNAQVGLRSFIAGFGLRAEGTYNLSSKTFGADALLTKDLGTGGFVPYIGVGAGAKFGSGSTSPYVAGALGADFSLFSNIGLFGEVRPSYSLDSAVTNKLGVNVALGLKLNF